ncbi:asparagine synthase related protein [Talaromyces stipitatus ATCC 10500]|uniref:Asparagine synthase related protein n=1 Tax=Talaromyces stipitatus (strain ATCC 10500 / CBS 375.48 / QM 6759 / NRRL 1006) TaxID=441959 RepID=B8LWJ5_TALSN|nr:asparagine synthase related protein [Talaromyces stipitatus ATCC 10500]EED24306.1 asparagine synthase related protein [Talaromyces stipitatus ATCC 10500]
MLPGYHASEHVLPQKKTATWLRNRGPDNYHTHLVKLESPGLSTSAPETIYLTFISSVLALRGDHVTSQPLVDTDSNSVLCWNGEAWKINGELIDGNDTQLVFQELIEASRYRHDVGESEESRLNDSVARLTNIISNIRGPFAFVFYDGVHRRLYFSRDCLGRRSLLRGQDDHGNLKICSVCDALPGASFEEVECDGVHVIDLSRISLSKDPEGTRSISYEVEVIPWSYGSTDAPRLKNPVAPMNRTSPSTDPPSLSLSSSCVHTLEDELRLSVEVRVRNIPQLGHGNPGTDAKVGVLFSGGLDCTLLARLAHDALPKEESIDLINVAFENPRVAAALKAKNEKVNGNEEMTSIYESCPDRITGRAGHAELQKVCPDRVWRFVAVNVPFQDFTAHRDEVIQLIRPHNTEMDLSIACALYFASRGQGVVTTNDSSDATTTYTTTARVLLSGLGADELFAGYGRHGIAFARKGFQGLIDEIDLDVGRLGKRNLGRDDRVISNWGREARFPFLDEEFVSWATQTPVWERCGFGTAKAKPIPDDDLGQIAENLDSEKKALRLLALKLGMIKTAREKKRAIQFGSRTAKMESGRSKGTQTI